jgi:hypothetical protein
LSIKAILLSKNGIEVEAAVACFDAAVGIECEARRARRRGFGAGVYDSLPAKCRTKFTPAKNGGRASLL